MSVTRARFEASAETEKDVQFWLDEEYRAFVARHKGAKHWTAVTNIQTTAIGFWGYMVIAPPKEVQA